MNKGKKKDNGLSDLTSKGIFNLIGVLLSIAAIILTFISFTSEPKYLIFGFLTFILSKTFFYFSNVSK